MPPTATVRIVERHGYDIAPIDVTSPDGELNALSYIWPDQTDRLGQCPGQYGDTGCRSRRERSFGCATVVGVACYAVVVEHE
ncbi:Uncharacterized protein conserved in bacteria (DUF2332) [Mycobacterium tuberculosis]|nr:Uncharacterized protein conserved in bacteria (DUF2332) [Mycobacterium tuberculosis]